MDGTMVVADSIYYHARVLHHHPSYYHAHHHPSYYHARVLHHHPWRAADATVYKSSQLITTTAVFS